MTTKLTHCRLCKSKKLIQILDLGMQALTGVFPRTIDSVPKSPLELLKCDECHLVQLGHSVDKAFLFGDNYGYRSGLNQTMVRHLKGHADSLLKKYVVKTGDLIVDVGSNDGTLLKSYEGGHNYELLGVDPTIPKFKDFYPPHIKQVPHFFESTILPRKAKIITSIAMFYDLEDPLAFAKEVANSLTVDGVWLFEVSYLPSVIENLAYDSICHEHLEYYSITVLDRLLSEANLKIVDVSFNDSNGGSVAITAAHLQSSYPVSPGLDNILGRSQEWTLQYTRTYESFSDRVQGHKKELTELLCDLRDKEEIVFGYGASTKGNVLLQYCGVTPNELPAIAEVNKDKFGCFTPGSNIQIIDQELARDIHPDYFLVLPWHFREGIIAQEKEFLAEGGKLIFPLPGRPSIVEG